MVYANYDISTANKSFCFWRVNGSMRKRLCYDIIYFITWIEEAGSNAGPGKYCSNQGPGSQLRNSQVRISWSDSQMRYPDLIQKLLQISLALALALPFGERYYLYCLGISPGRKGKPHLYYLDQQSILWPVGRH